MRDDSYRLRVAQKIDTLVTMLPKPISVSGIKSQYISNEWIELDVYFIGPQATAKLTIEAYLVQDLEAKLPAGIDVLGPEGFILNFDQKVARIASYNNMEFRISVNVCVDSENERLVTSQTKTLSFG